MASRTKGYETFWVVGHPEHCNAYVIAESWAEATVLAAKFWGVPWKEVACHCDMLGRHEAKKNVCLRCRRIIYGKDRLCQKCETELRHEDEEAVRRLKKTWYLGRKRA